MRQNKWQVMPGVGAKCLETLSRDVTRRNRWSDDSLAGMEAMAQDLEDSARRAAREVTSRAVTDHSLDDLDALVEGLDEAQKEEVIKAYMASAAVTAMTAERSGTSFGQGRLARLTVKEEGVLSQTGLMIPLRGLDLSTTGAQELEPGSVVEGRVSEFSSAPAIGGSIQLDHFILNSLAQGLVNPTDGEPRVELDIFVRNR